MTDKERKRIKDCFEKASLLAEEVVAGSALSLSSLNQLRGFLRGCVEGMEFQNIEAEAMKEGRK